MARDKKHSARRLELGDLVLDQGKQEVTVCGVPYHLTPQECRLLATFMQHAGEVLTKAFLMREVWDTDYAEDARTIQVHVSWLRSKIEEDRSNPRRILTVRGVGYMLAQNGRA